VRAAADLHLVRHLPREGRRARPPCADQQRHLAAQRLVGETRARREREPLAGEAGSVTGEQPADDLDRLAQSGKGVVLVEAELVEPGSGDEAEVCATAGGEV